MRTHTDHRKLQRRSTRELFDLILSHLPASKTKLEERTGLHHSHLVRVMTRMHNEKLIYIARWTKKGKGVGAVWKAGNEPDAPKPVSTKTSTDYNRAYRQRMKLKSNTTRNEQFKEANRIRTMRRYYKDRAPKADPFTSIFFRSMPPSSRVSSDE